MFVVITVIFFFFTFSQLCSLAKRSGSVFSHWRTMATNCKITTIFRNSPGFVIGTGTLADGKAIE